MTNEETRNPSLASLHRLMWQKLHEDRRRWLVGTILLSLGILVDTILTVSVIYVNDGAIRTSQRAILRLQRDQVVEGKRVTQNSDVIAILQKEHDITIRDFKQISAQIKLLRDELKINRSLQQGAKLEKAAASVLQTAKALEAKSKKQAKGSRR